MIIERLQSTEWRDKFRCLLCYEQFEVAIDSDAQRHPSKGHHCKHGWAGDTGDATIRAETEQGGECPECGVDIPAREMHLPCAECDAPAPSGDRP